VAPRLTVKYLPLDWLVPAERNPKGHDIDGIRSSIETFGFMDPTLLDGRTGRLISGHGRMETLVVMRDAGAEPPAGIVVDKNGWLVPVTHGWESRSDADAALVALNRLPERGGWDNAGLVELLTELDDEHRLVAGFADGEYAALIALDQPPQLRPDGADDQSGTVATHFAVIIDCADEAEQAALLDRFLEEGLTCRALM
jgi:ParB-like chromosome segregation protein Spo0J